MSTDPIVLAVPKGRILNELRPMLDAAGIRPEPAFDAEDNRQLRFATDGFRPDGHPVEIIRVRSFDAATFVAFGGAHLGVAGNDVLLEFNFDDVYAPVDLGIGACRLSVAEPAALAPDDDPTRWSHIRVATKYPNLTRAHFAARGVQAEVIKLNGAMELAPSLGMCRRIVDLVSTGSTLRANGLVEVEVILRVTSRLAVNRPAWKTRPRAVGALIDRLRDTARAAAA